jgi:hypothetical protein
MCGHLGADTHPHRNIALQVGLDDAKCGGAKEISREREIEIIARREKENNVQEREHLPKRPTRPSEAFKKARVSTP